MSDYRYKFFFSYARKDYESAKRTIMTNDGPQPVNYLEIFFEEICKGVAGLTNEYPDKVAYRDKDRLKIADFWSRQLVQGLQNSDVLLAIVSPAYLGSENCGREVQFFIERLNRLSDDQQQSYRIIPVFWEDTYFCFNGLNKNTSEFLKRLQWNQEGMPKDYPIMGIGQMYRLMNNRACAQVVEQIARRIVDLANLEPRLCYLPGEDDFSDLPSAFKRREDIPVGDIPVASGLTGTNVVYIVANKDNQPESWQPFNNDNITIEQATQNGLKKAGQTGTYYNLKFPRNLLRKIQDARDRNSPVLMVLDHHALSTPEFKSPLRRYDGADYLNVGLVTASGSDGEDDILRDVFQTKFAGQRPHHIWKVPANCQEYENSVSKVVTDLKSCLLRTGKLPEPQPPAQMPGL
ncbi:MAG: toll/interleukin-1 receptor domain-containing protein [Candidatus Competibacteraceae bacterium]